MANKPPGALWIYNPVRPNDLDDNYPEGISIVKFLVEPIFLQK